MEHLARINDVQFPKYKSDGYQEVLGVATNIYHWSSAINHIWPNSTQPNPTYGSTQPMAMSVRPYNFGASGDWTVGRHWLQAKTKW